MKLLPKTEGEREPAPRGLSKFLGGVRKSAPARISGGDIGSRYELISEKLDRAQHLLDHLSSLSELVTQVRAPITADFNERCAEHAELQTTRHTLAGAEARLSALETERQAFAARADASDRALADAAQRAEAQETAIAAKDREIEQLKLDRAQARTQAGELAEGLKTSLARAAKLEEDAGALRTHADAVEAKRRDTETLAQRLQQELDLAREEIAVLKRHRDGSGAEAAKLARTVSELEERLKTEQTRGEALVIDARAAETAVAAAQRVAEGAAERARVDLAELSARAETALARASKLDELNAELSRSLADVSAAQRGADLEIAEMKVTARRLGDTARNAEDASATLKRDFAASDAARLAAVERAEELAKALKKRDAALKKAEDKAAAAAARLDAEQLDHARRRADLEERIAALEAQAERERAERTITEGALNSARKERLRLQGALIAAGQSPESGEAPRLAAGE